MTNSSTRNETQVLGKGDNAGGPEICKKLERLTLSCLINEPDLLFVRDIDKSYFTGEYANIFTDIKKMIKGNGVDTHILSEKYPYIFDIAIETIERRKYDIRVSELLKHKISREVSKSATILRAKTIDVVDPQEYIADIQNIIDAVNNDTDGEKTRQQTLEEVTEKIMDDTKTDVIYSGLGDREHFRKGQLITVGARPSVGKSVVMMNMMMNAMGNGHKGCFFSLEMSQKEMISRSLSCLSGIQYKKIDEKTFSKKEKEILRDTLEAMKGLNCRFFAKSMDIIKLEANIRVLSKRDGFDMFFIDYLQLIKITGKRDRTSIGEITKKLKQLALELQVVIVIGSQLSRDIEKRRDSTPKLSDLRESGDIEQDSDIVIMLHRDFEVPEVMEIMIRKNRNGKLHEFDIKFDGSTMTIG